MKKTMSPNSLKNSGSGWKEERKTKYPPHIEIWLNRLARTTSLTREQLDKMFEKILNSERIQRDPLLQDEDEKLDFAFETLYARVYDPEKDIE